MPERGLQLGDIGHVLCCRAQRPRHADEIRGMDIHPDRLDRPIDHVFLDFLVPLVIPQQHDQRYLCLHCTGQFRQGELQTTITNQAHRRSAFDGLLGTAQPGAHGCWQRVTQGAVTGRGVEPAAWLLHVECQVAGVHRLGRVAHQNGSRQALQYGAQQTRLAQGGLVPVCRQDLAQVGHAGHAPSAFVHWLRLGLQGTEQRFGCQLGIGHQRQLRQIIAHGLVRVDVNAQQTARDLEASLEGHVIIGFGQFGADRQHHVSLGHQRPCGG
ncbi:hypothetical protein D3C80_843450 [compost metagenome]